MMNVYLHGQKLESPVTLTREYSGGYKVIAISRNGKKATVYLNADAVGIKDNHIVVSSKRHNYWRVIDNADSILIDKSDTWADTGILEVFV